MIKRSEILVLWGIGTLILGIHFGDSQLFTYSAILFTGSVITGAIENKK